MTSLNRRSLLAGSAAAGVVALAGPARAQETPGVTATELKIGCTTSLSGPVSALGTIARCSDAYFKMVNEQGGIAGRKINFIFYDDAFNPAKTVEQTRKLIESDNVAFLFSMLGTSPNSAVVKYINANKVPHLFLSVNGDKWGDYATYPWTMGFAPSSRTEAQIFAKYALSQKPDAKFALLYQNDDLGKDFVNGLKDVLGAQYEARVKAVSYEVTDPTVDSQIVTLRASGADVLISGVTARFAAQAIRKVFELDWKPMHFVTSGASSVSSTIMPVGPERALGLITSTYIKDPSDPGMGRRRRDEGLFRLHGEILWRRQSEGGAQRLWLHGHLGAEEIAGAVQRQFLARQHHGPGQQSEKPRGPDAAAGRSRQHQPDQPPPAAADAAAALGRQGLCPVRQHHRGGQSLISAAVGNTKISLRMAHRRSKVGLNQSKETPDDHALSLPRRALVPAGVDAGRDGAAL